MERQTGRTHRLCLKAALEASSGKRVCFVVGNTSEYTSVMATLFKTVDGCAQMSTGGYDYPGGGFIRVSYARSCFAGLKYDVLIEDELLGMNWRQIEEYKHNLRGVLL